MEQSTGNSISFVLTLTNESSFTNNSVGSILLHNCKVKLA